MPTVEINEDVDRYLEFAARVAGISKGEVIARLVAADGPELDAGTARIDAPVPIHADYEGVRTRATFTPGPNRVEITSGALAGESFRTPSEAARHVVGALKPGVSPHRNGWTFWIITATGAPLQAIRHRMT